MSMSVRTAANTPTRVVSMQSLNVRPKFAFFKPPPVGNSMTRNAPLAIQAQKVPSILSITVIIDCSTHMGRVYSNFALFLYCSYAEVWLFAAA